MIALLCSVGAEADQLLALTTIAGTTKLGSTTVLSGTLAARPVLLCAGGMGKVNAAHAATLLLTQFHPETLLVFGVGGAYPASGAKIGDIALASEEIAGDDGVRIAEGFKDTAYIGIPLVNTGSVVYHNHFPGNAPLLRNAQKTLSATLPPGNFHTGKFVTLSTSSGTTVRARELEDRYRALCENMEGAAAAQVAALHDVPWLEIRGISNIVEDRDKRHWDIPKAAGAVQKAVLNILTAWEP